MAPSKKGSVAEGQLLISLFSIKPHFLLTLWHPLRFGDFWKKNAQTHVASCRNISDLVCSTDPVEVSKHTASLLVCTQKKIFLLGECGFLVSDVISGGLLGHLGPLCLALGTNR